MNLILSESDIKTYIIGKPDIVIYGIGDFGKCCFDLCSRNHILISAIIDNYSVETYCNIQAVKPNQGFAENPHAVYIIASKGHYQAMYDDCVKNCISEENIYVFFPQHEILSIIKGLTHALGTINDRLSHFDTAIRRIMPRPLLNLSLHLVHQCNLNCKGCDQFSPLADEWYADIEAFKKDMSRMSDIFDGEAEHVWVCGGEPLLHPDITEFMKVARENFKKAKLCILTNGLLLPKMNDEFWSCCRELNIILIVTRYPVHFDYAAMNEKADSFGVKFEFRDYKEATKTLWKYPLNLSGNCDPLVSFQNCNLANLCIFLSEGGKAYNCVIAGNFNLFNKYFNLDIVESKNNYINIYSETSREEILHFLSKAVPLCSYCDVSKRVFGFDFEVSKRNISEWTLDVL